MQTRFLIILLAFVLTDVSLAVENGGEIVSPALREKINRAKVFEERLVSVSDSASAQESEKLWDCLNLVSSDRGEALKKMEQFVLDYPNSGWTPSLRANLALYYRKTGLYSQALEHWQLAWDATKGLKGENGKRVADFTILNWTSLLASLGRIDILEKVFKEGEGRMLNNGVWQKRFNDTKEALVIMKKNPGVAYKCGTFALAQVGRKLGKADTNRLKELMSIPSPETGFSMTMLTEFVEKFNLDLVPVIRSSGETIVVPSVLHWKQNHYAAIVEKKNDFYHVIDPTFGNDKWLRADVINSEASGHFLVPRAQKPEDWRLLAAVETDLVFGKGYPNTKPPAPPPCPEGKCCPPGGPTGSGGNGSSDHDQSGCNSCDKHRAAAGMAYWTVAEPYIELWVKDQPLIYQPSRGNPMGVTVNFHQFETRDHNTDIYNFGPSWNSDLLTYLEVTDDQQDVSFANYRATLFARNGGESQYAWTDIGPEYRTRSTFERLMAGTNLVGFAISYPDASRAVYGLLQDISTMTGAKRAFLSEWVSPEGFTNTYQYSTNTSVLLTNIVDVDGKNLKLFYSTNFPSQVSKIVSPYTNEVNFIYDLSSGRLTNIIDSVGISSQFQYVVSNGVPLMTNMATPYGNTGFNYIGPGITSTELGYNTITNTKINAVIEVSEPTGGKHVFMYRDDSGDFVPGYYGDAPIGFSWPYFPYEFNSLLGNGYMHFRNSYYWGPLQYQNLSTTNPTNFTTEDYSKGRLRNWLHGGVNGAMLIDPYTVSHTLNMERTPRPYDAAIEGQKTWYGYAGKEEGVDNVEGTNSHPNVIAQTLPDGNVFYKYMEYNQYGNITTEIQSYTRGAGIDTKTNIFGYAINGVDMISHTLLVDGIPILQDSNIYNGFHQVLTNYDALSQITVYTYNTNRQVTSVKRPSGLTTTNIYYANGELQKSIDIEIGRTNSYSYEGGRIKTHTNELDLVETYFWDALGRLKGKNFPDGSITNLYSISSPLPGGTGTNLLDVTQTRDKLTNSTFFTYNGIRQKTSITNALTNVTQFTYCTCGALESIRDALSNYTHFYYDTAGRLTNTVYADNYAVTNFYSSLGRLTNTIDSAGVSITNYYNNQGLLVLSSNAFGQVLSHSYDIEDHLVNSVDANGVSMDMTYDALGRVLTRSYPDGGVERFGYSARGLTIYTNQLTTNITRYAYNEAGWKTSETNANGDVTQFGYDFSGNLTALLDGKSQLTEWRYDQFGRVTNKWDDNANWMFVYRYNANGWLTNRWTPQKGDAYYSHDKVGNLTNVAYATSTNLTFNYDALNRLTNMMDAVGTTKFGYTVAGLLALEDGPWVNDTVSYSYTNRVRAAMTILAPNSSAWSQTYGYDAANRLSNIVSGVGNFVYAYQPSMGGVTTASGLIQKIELPNGAYITNTFDDSARLLSTILNNSTNGILNAHEYVYNVGNQRTKQTRTAGDYVDYTYDPIGQLKTAVGKELGGVTNRLQEQMGYVYDEAGNLSGRTNNGFRQSFNVNSLNELTTVSRNATNRLTVAGTTTATATNVTVNSSNAVLYLDWTFASTNHSITNATNSFIAIARDSLGRRDTNSITVYLPTNAVYAYDLNGNLTNDSAKVFEYDDENQLTRVTKTNEFKKEYVYDGKMRLRIRKEFAWRNSAWTKTNEIRFIWDGDVIVQQRDANNLPTLTFTRGTDLSASLQGAGGIGGLLAMIDSRLLPPTSFYYHADGNGNITALTDSRQQIAARYLYDSFGIPLSVSGPQAFVNPIWFSSQFYEWDTDLLHYKFRIYAPQKQRWATGDPLSERGFRNLQFEGSALNFHLNLYSFVNNEPISNLDLLGLYDKKVQDCIDGCLAAAKTLGKEWGQQCVQNCMDGKPPPAPIPMAPGKPGVGKSLKNLCKILKRWYDEGHPGETKDKDK